MSKLKALLEQNQSDTDKDAEEKKKAHEANVAKLATEVAAYLTTEMKEQGEPEDDDETDKKERFEKMRELKQLAAKVLAAKKR